MKTIKNKKQWQAPKLLSLENTKTLTGSFYGTEGVHTGPSTYGSVS